MFFHSASKHECIQKRLEGHWPSYLDSSLCLYAYEPISGIHHKWNGDFFYYAT